MSRVRARGPSNRSSRRLSNPSAAYWLFRCMSPFLTDTLFKEAARLMHRILLAQKHMRVVMEVLRRCLDGATNPDDRNQSVKSFLVERLMRFRRGHDELQSHAVVELNDLVDVVGIEFFERLVHQQKGRLWRRVATASEMIEVRRCSGDAETNIERNEFLPTAGFATTLFKI